MRSIFLIFTVFLISCSPLTPLIPEGVTIQGMESFEEEEAEEAIILTDKKEIRTFQAGVWGADRQPGVADVVDPDFSFTLGQASYFLWWDAELLMNQKNTHILYTLKKRDHENMKRVIEEKMERP